MDTEPFTAIDLAELGLEDLEDVVGGRVDPGPQTMSPQASDTFQKASAAFSQGMQAIASGRQSELQNMMGLFQQVAGARGGGGGGRG